jgi:hypothetical protein
MHRPLMPNPSLNLRANGAKFSGQMHMAANTVMVSVASVRPPKK